MKTATVARMALIALGVFVATGAVPLLHRGLGLDLFPLRGLSGEIGAVGWLLPLCLLALAYVLIRHAHGLVGWAGGEGPLGEVPYFEPALYRSISSWAGFLIVVQSALNLLLTLATQFIPRPEESSVRAIELGGPWYWDACWHVGWIGVGAWLVWIAPWIVIGLPTPSAAPTEKPLAYRRRVAPARLAVRLAGLVLAGYAIYHAIYPLFGGAYYLAMSIDAEPPTPVSGINFPLVLALALGLGLLARRYVKRGCPLRTGILYGHVGALPGWERATHRFIATGLAIATLASGGMAVTGTLPLFFKTTDPFLSQVYTTARGLMDLLASLAVLAFSVYLFRGAPHLVRWQFDRFAGLPEPASPEPEANGEEAS